VQEQDGVDEAGDVGPPDFKTLDYSGTSGSTAIEIATSFLAMAAGVNTVNLAGFDNLDAGNFVTT
jgi:hypothetical protein